MTGRRATDAAAFAVAAAGIVLLAADQGGFFQRTWAPATLGFAAAAAIALILLEGLLTSRAALVLVAGLAALAGWTALSASWSSEPHASLHEAERALVYVAAALLLAALAAAGASTALLAGLVAGVFGVASYSLVDRIAHGPHLADVQGPLLERPLGYANALGALCAIAAVAAVLLAWTVRRPLVVGAATGAVAVFAAALWLTGSVGSWAAAIAGAAAGLAATRGRRWWTATGAVIAAGLAGGFVSAAVATPSALQQRGAYWHVAWQVIERRPLAGRGAGTFDGSWIRYGDLVRWDVTLDAHSLYLETWAELGVVGLALVLVALLAPLASARAAAAIGGATAFLVHAGLDWDWEMPAVTFAGLVCLAACLEPRTAVGPRLRGASLAAAAALVVLAAAQVFRRLGLY